MDRDDYFMGIAYAVAARSSCVKRKCGAVIVVDQHIVSTGYNGTPEGVTNCADGGCVRCSDGSLKSGEKFDECICEHAEKNAIFFAARHGNQCKRGVMYSTLRPCLWCLSAIIQAGIKDVCYAEAWPEGYDEKAQYHVLEYKVNVHWINYAMHSTLDKFGR